jgi:hypothetical protein
MLQSPRQVPLENYSQKTPCGIELALAIINPFNYNPYSRPLSWMNMNMTLTPCSLHGIWPYNYICNDIYDYLMNSCIVTTLGSQPRQGLVKVQAKCEDRECGKVWGNEAPHSQVSSHFGSWNLDGFMNHHRAIVRVKTHWIKKFLISVEHRFLKWAHMTHLDTSNTSYGQKKGRESNC